MAGRGWEPEVQSGVSRRGEVYSVHCEAGVLNCGVEPGDWSVADELVGLLGVVCGDGVGCW